MAVAICNQKNNSDWLYWRRPFKRSLLPHPWSRRCLRGSFDADPEYKLGEKTVTELTPSWLWGVSYASALEFEPALCMPCTAILLPPTHLYYKLVCIGWAQTLLSTWCFNKPVCNPHSIVDPFLIKLQFYTPPKASEYHRQEDSGFTDEALLISNDNNNLLH